MSAFELSEIQARAILELRLRTLTGLEIDKIVNPIDIGFVQPGKGILISLQAAFQPSTFINHRLTPFYFFTLL